MAHPWATLCPSWKWVCWLFQTCGKFLAASYRSQLCSPPSLPKPALKTKYGLCGAAGVFFLWKDRKYFSSNLFSIFPKWGFSEKEFKRQFNSQWFKAGLMALTLHLKFMAASQDHITCRHHRDIPCSFCAQCGQDLIHFTWEAIAENVPSVSASRYPMPHLLLKLSLSSDAPLFHHLLFRHCLFHEQFPAFPGSYWVCLPSVLLLPLRTLGQCFIYCWVFFK